MAWPELYSGAIKAGKDACFLTECSLSGSLVQMTWPKQIFGAASSSGKSRLYIKD